MSRNTSQRQALERVFQAAGRPLSPAEALQAAQSEIPRLGMATVYRTLKMFVEEGWLKPVDVPGEGARYELARLAHHHHFRCRMCGRMFDLKGCPGELKSLAPPRFLVESHEILLVGLCADCR